MKRLAFLLAFIAAFLLQPGADAAGPRLVSLSPSTVSGGATLTGTVSLASAAGAGGEVVNLSSSNSKANVPATVTVPQGKSTAKFTITTDELTVRTTATITATADGVSKSATLTIDPLALSSVSFSPSIITAETTTTGTVKLNGKAKTGGFVVALSSNSAYLDVPSSVTVPAGASSVTFEAEAGATSAERLVTVTATANGVSKTTKPKVVPLTIKSITSSAAVNSGRPITPKVNMSGIVAPGGAVVTLNSNRPSILPVPASITVPAGATYLSVPLTANFVSTPTIVTLTARYDGISKQVAITVNPVVVSSLSFSPASPTGSLDTTFKVTLSAPADVAGYTVALSSSNPALAPVPDSVFIGAGLTSASMVVSTNYTDVEETVIISATLNGVTKTYNLVIKPVMVSSVSASSSPVGGNTNAITIYLTANAPTGGHVVEMTSSNPSLITVPATVTVPAGSKMLQVQYTSAVSMTSPVVTVTVNDDNFTKTLTITIQKPKIYSVSLNSAITTGGSATTGTIVLTGPAPAGGIWVELTGNSPAIVPTQIFVPGGEKQVSMAFNTLPVAAKTIVSITASWDGTSFSKNLTIEPPVLKDLVPRPITLSPGGTSPVTVRLTGPAPLGGYTVTLTSTSPTVATVPATIVVPAGASQATFNVTVSGSATNGQTTKIRATAASKITEANASVTTLVMADFILSSYEVIGGSNLTGTITLSGPAPVGGLSVTVYSNNPKVVPATAVAVSSGQSSVTFPITTDFVSSITNTLVYADFATSALSRDLVLDPLRPTALTLDVNEIEGGDTATGTLTFNGPAPSAGGLEVAVNLSTSNGSVTVPATVTVVPGQSTATFSITGVPVAEQTSVTVTASFNGGTVTATLDVNPPRLETVSLDLAEVTGGHEVVGTVQITSPAPVGGWLINLEGSSNKANVPGSVMILEGSTIATFPVDTVPVAVDTVVTVTASRDGFTPSATFTIIPPRLIGLEVVDADLEGGFAATAAIVNLDGAAPAGGWIVSLSGNNSSALPVPASVTVLAGQSSGSVLLTSNMVASDAVVTVTATKVDRTFTRDINVRAIKVTGLELSVSSITGGTATVTGTITINRSVPTGTSVEVTITDSHDAASMPSVVYIPANSFTETFTITTNAVASSTLGTISAAFNGSDDASLTVIPPVVTSVVIAPDPIVGGVENSVGTVTLNGPAPAEMIVDLAETSSVIATLPSIEIVEGATSGTFPVFSSPVVIATAADVTASFQASSAMDTVVVNPVPLQGLTLAPSSVVGGSGDSVATIKILVNAPVGGTTFALASGNTSVATVPSSVTIPAGQSQVTFPVVSAITGTTQTSMISATFGVVTVNSTLTVTPLGVSTVTLSKGIVQGGSENSTGTVTMNAAPKVDTVVTLTSSNTAAVTVPVSVTVLAGETTATFTLTTSYIDSNSSSTISATYNGVTKTIGLTVNAIKLNAVSIAPASVVGGLANATGTVTLSAAAVAPVTVTLTSTEDSAEVPASVIVPIGQSTVNFQVTSSNVTSVKNATISGAFNGTTKTFAFTVNPHKVLSVSLNKSSVIGGSENLNATVTLNAAAPAGGTVVTISVSPNSHATAPATLTIASGSTTGTVLVTTIRQAVGATITVGASYNDSSASATATIKPPTVKTVSVSPSPVLGTTSTTGTVTIDVTAPVGGFEVALTASNSGASVPSTVTIEEGATSATFPVTTIAVASNRSVTITATANEVAVTGSMQVNAPGVASLVVSPNALVGGNSATATVTLTGPAPAAGFLVTVTDNNGVAAVSNITVAAGQTTGSSTVTTVAVSSDVTVTVTATANGTTKTATLDVDAPVVTSLVLNPSTVRGGLGSTGTVTISSPAPSGGLTIAISDTSSNVGTPSSVVIPGGSTSVNFAITTSSVGSNQTKQVKATLNGVITSANLTLTKN